MSVTKPLVQVIDYDGQHKDYIVTKTTVMDVVGTTIPDTGQSGLMNNFVAGFCL